MKNKYKSRISIILVGVLITSLLGVGLVLAGGEAQWPDTTTPVSVKLQTGDSAGYWTWGTRTSDGNYIMLFEDAVGILLAQKIDSDGNKLWNGGSPVVVDAVNDVGYEAVADNSGGAFFLHQGAGATYYVSRINSAGVVQWTTGNFDATLGETAARVLHDGNDGVYVAWSSGSPLELFVTHLGSDGAVCSVATCGSDWNSGGSGTYRPVRMPLAAGAAVNYSDGRLVLSDSGSIIIVYRNYPSQDNLWAVRLNADGSNAWGATDYYVQIDDTAPTSYYQAETDGSGGVFIGYYAYPSLKLSKINSAGSFTIGNATGGQVIKTIDPVTWRLRYLVSTADDSGNFYLGWNESPITPSEYDAYVQKFNSTGVEQWTAGGVIIGQQGDGINDYFDNIQLNNKPHNMSTDGAGGVITATQRYGSGISQAIALQKVSSTGTLEWGRYGTYVTENVCTDGDAAQNVISDGVGGAIVNWYQWTASTGEEYISAQAVSDQPAYSMPSNDTIQIHTNLPRILNTYGVGISNGDDAGALTDIDFGGSPTTNSCNFGSESYAFSSGEPTKADLQQNFEIQSWTDALEQVGGGLLSNENDKYSTEIPLGFTATIYGKDVDTVRITSNGFVYLNNSTDMDGTDVAAGDGYSMTDYLNLPSSVDGSATGDILISGAWGQIDTTKTSDDRIRYYSDPANELFIIDMYLMEHPTDTDNINTQIKIMGNGEAGDESSGAPCVNSGDGVVCGTLGVSCATTATIFTDVQNDFQLGTSGSRTIATVNDSSYSQAVNGSYFDETTPGVFVDLTDTVTLNSNTVYTCGDPTRSVSLTASATPFVNGSAEPLMTLGSDGLVGGTGAAADYYAVFSIITSGTASCGAGCVEANGNVESNNTEKNGELNFFANAGPNDSNLSASADANSILIGTDGTTNTVTLYEASHGVEGDVAVEGVGFNLAIPSTPEYLGTFTTTVTYTLS